MKENNSSAALRKIDFLIGSWKTEGKIIDENGEATATIKGTDSYEWAAGGFFILHRVDVMMGDEKVEVIEIIGYEEKDKKYSMRSFDNQGNFTTMEAVIENNVFRLLSDNMRSTLTPGKGGHSMKAKWERSEDGKEWRPWMDMIFRNTDDTD